MAPTITTSDLIFSSQANHNFSKTLGELKKHTLSITNRLQSILTDASFVQKVAEAYEKPLIANERCGSWYIDPAQKDGSAYFKSTDGHTGVWKFSTRRLNVHLLETIGKHDGCIIVDSTRRGKRMPDALSKTIPIWCCVLNRALFPTQPDVHDLYTPPQAVSSSEHSQIQSCINEFLQSFLALGLDISALRGYITKPLRPLWVTPESDLEGTQGTPGSFEGFHAVICCTSSRRVTGGEVSEGGYIQGAGDDTENWARGLTPPVFWNNLDLLLSTSEKDLEDLIDDLVANAPRSSLSQAKLLPIAPTSSIFITSLLDLESRVPEPHDVFIKLSPKTTDASVWQKSRTVMDIGIGAHKLGSRNLRIAFPHIISFLKASLSKIGHQDVKISVACETGRDFSVGVTLAILCIFFKDDGSIFDMQAGASDLGTDHIDKSFIRSRLSWIMTSMPDANPSRSTLQSVNSYLMDRIM